MDEEHTKVMLPEDKEYMQSLVSKRTEVFSFKPSFDEVYREAFLKDLMYRVDHALNGNESISGVMDALGLTPAATSMMKAIQEARAQRSLTPNSIRKFIADKRSKVQRGESLSVQEQNEVINAITQEENELQEEARKIHKQSLYEERLKIKELLEPFVDKVVLPAIRATINQQYTDQLKEHENTIFTVGAE